MLFSKSSLTPLMQQYHQIKRNHKDAILFFRLGDFYEMFGEDAITASPVLGVVLTKRQNVPMCGVPHHSISNYLSKLIKSGYKVAICEQIEKPEEATGKIVKREVVRIITPGTLLEENLLDTRKNNFLLALYHKSSPDPTTSEHFGLAYIDISTGDFYITEISDDKTLTKLFCELAKINPSEYVLPESYKNSNFITKYLNRTKQNINFIDDWFFEYQISTEKLQETFKITSLKSFGIEEKNLAICACGAVLKYLEDTQKTVLVHFKPPKFYSTEEYMILDETAIKSLELVENITTKTRENTLLDVLDKTVTVMGSRTLRKYILQPLTNTDKIKHRQQAVQFFIDEGIARRQIQELLKGVSDIERILSRIASGLATPKDVVALKETLILVPKIKSSLNTSETFLDTKPEIVRNILTNLYDLSEITILISSSMVDDPPNDISKGGVIRSGFNIELDNLRKIAHSGKSYLAELEQKERLRTGINSLKIGYTSIFGYYIEVTKPNLHLVPENYTRKQTLVSSERFETPELKEYEQKVLSAEEKISRIEHELFNEIKLSILNQTEKLHNIAQAIAELDLYCCLAKVAVENNFTKPTVTYNYKIEIKDGRHPVIEKKLTDGKLFVSNETLLDNEENQIVVLTGPNMAGKSTYLRQVALIVIMSQIGSFVPAGSASIGIVDRIFTRIGASDNLAGGESTFMVEMRETANILHNVSNRSLLILDEIGRGTSTYDGISIAWSVIEYLSDSLHKPKVLFATHYFELTDLSECLSNVKNYNVSVKEFQDEIIFLHKIIPGSANRSYGIHVAKLAGLPENVIERAKSVLVELEKKSKTVTVSSEKVTHSNSLFSTTERRKEEETPKSQENKRNDHRRKKTTCKIFHN